MVFRKLPAGTQRTLIYRVRVRPHFKTLVDEKLKWLRTQPTWKDATAGDLIRIAVDEYCRKPEDPRKA